MENDEQPIKAEESDDELQRESALTRRDFLTGLRKWSAAVIGVALAGEILTQTHAQGAWVNGRGGAWANGGRAWANRGGGGGAWVNGGGGGGAWANRGTAWANGGRAWANRSGGGGGGAWVNRRGY